jgi:hypothetical protein
MFVKKKVENNKEKRESIFLPKRGLWWLLDKISLNGVNSRKNSFWA